MTDIHLKAGVVCADGPGGRCTHVLIDPEHEQLKHLVVRVRGRHPTERLVSIDQIEKATPGQIHLRCTREELATMEPFIETRYVQVMRRRYEELRAPDCQDHVPERLKWVRMKHKHIPKGERAVHEDAQVRATDGRVGTVDDLWVDLASGRITHMVLRERHLWAQDEVAIPISKVAHLGEKVVYLNLDRHAVKSLPTLPGSRRQ